jgi:hypothetical protein
MPAGTGERWRNAALGGKNEGKNRPFFENGKGDKEAL